MCAPEQSHQKLQVSSHRRLLVQAGREYHPKLRCKQEVGEEEEEDQNGDVDSEQPTLGQRR